MLENVTISTNVYQSCKVKERQRCACYERSTRVRTYANVREGVRLSVQRDARAGSFLSESGKVRELLHLHLAMHRRSVKAPVHGSITCQRGMDNVAAWWSVTSTEAYSEILEYTRFYRLKISARRFSFNFSFNIFFFFGSIDQPNTTARYCRLLSFVSLINNRIVETVFRILKLYSKICANNYYFENIVFFFFFSFAFLLGKSKLQRPVKPNCIRWTMVLSLAPWFCYTSRIRFLSRAANCTIEFRECR